MKKLVVYIFSILLLFTACSFANDSSNQAYIGRDYEAVDIRSEEKGRDFVVDEPFVRDRSLERSDDYNRFYAEWEDPFDPSGYKYYRFPELSTRSISSQINTRGYCAPIDLGSDMTYMIIGRKMFSDEIMDFIEFKEEQGQIVGYYQLEDIICNYEEGDIPYRIRSFLQDAKSASNVDYLLLLGTPLHTELIEVDYGECEWWCAEDECWEACEFGNTKTIYPDFFPKVLTYEWEMPIRYVDGVDGVDDIESIPTDQYYASLEGNWDDNNNGIYGEFLLEDNIYEFDLKPDLYVGRVPVQTEEGLLNWISKTKNWKVPIDPIHSEFISHRCIDADYSTDNNGDPDNWPLSYVHNMKFNYCLEDEGGVISDFANNDKSDYVSTYSHGYFEGIVKSVDYAGDKGEEGGVYGYELFKGQGGFDKAPVLFTHGCQVGGLDYSAQSLGEELISREDGIVAMVASSRSHQDIRFEFWKEVFFNHHYELSEAVYEYKYRRFYYESLDKHELKNFLMFNVFGDPNLKLFDPQLELFVDNQIVDFKAEDSVDVDLSLVNNSDNDLELDFQSPFYGDIFLQEKVETNIKKSMDNDFWYEVSGLLFFEPSQWNYLYLIDNYDQAGFSAMAGDMIYKLYDGFAMSCGAKEDLGDKWRINVKIPFYQDKEVNLLVKVNPGYIHVNPKPEPVTAYSSSIDLSSSADFILEFDKVADQDSLEDYFDNDYADDIAYSFGKINVELLSNNDGAVLARCTS